MTTEKTGPEIVKELKDKAQWVRQTVLDMSVKAKSGHVTTAFSQAEMLVALYYGGIMNIDPKNPKWDGRDRFILSKGQGGIGSSLTKASSHSSGLTTLPNPDQSWASMLNGASRVLNY